MSRKKVYNEKHITGFLLFMCFLQTSFLGLLLFILVSLHIPDIRSVAHYQPPQATLIYDRNGTIIDRMYIENRTVIPLSSMSPHLPTAFVAAEDGRFFEHPGLDFFSVLRAAINNLRTGGKGQGGSTITQQVAKSLLLTPEKTYVRKFKEAILAWRIDNLLSKEEILYIYLNQIYLGEGAYGVEAAAQIYFGKKASQLNLGECALLAGLPQAPSRYSLKKHLQRATERQKYVLNRMAADGYITVAEAKKGYNARISLNKLSLHSGPNSYYLEVVKKRARSVLNMPLQRAGAHIYTHLDRAMQRKAMTAVQKGTRDSFLRQKASGRKGSSVPQGALVCLETATGKVRSLVGGTDFKKSPFDRAVQARRPAGSTFKPFVYAAALKKGWAPESVIADSPLTVRGRNGRQWRPKNYSGKYHGQTTLRHALVHSYNAATVRLMQKVGVKPVVFLARKAGIESPMEPSLALALGAADVSLLEMTSAYTVFAGNGTSYPPAFIDKIVLSDGAVYRFSDNWQRKRVLQTGVLQQMQSMLGGVVTVGTGKRVRDVPGVRGGKTGTSNDNRDAWFIGYDNRYTTGVWLGRDRNQSLGRSESGGTAAAPVWRNFMLSVKKDF
ncbi:MAG: PBP1A family penicillin-binding protein [Deltaproteobacteria bacterium]|nr:PBP1A family penicillin-binding protein [Deltaproteobacteria bacterium]